MTSMLQEDLLRGELASVEVEELRQQIADLRKEVAEQYRSLNEALEVTHALSIKRDPLTAQRDEARALVRRWRDWVRTGKSVSSVLNATCDAIARWDTEGDDAR